VKAHVYIEGGGDSKELHIECRRGFRMLLEAYGFKDMPRLTACGGRGEAFDNFKNAHANASPDLYVAMLVDSEDLVADIEKPWEHLLARDNWKQPAKATDEQALLMTTCMETWIVTDREALRAHYGACLQESALPELTILEQRHRDAVQNALVRATRTCKNAYKKGKRSFEVLGALSPERLNEADLPSFQRFLRILRKKLKLKPRTTKK